MENRSMSISHTVERIGRAAADKEQGSRELLVYVPEFSPFDSGDIKATNVDVTVQTTDGSKGGETLRTIKTSNVIKAIYKGTTNEAFPPDVRRGETVTITNYVGTDVWYWSVQGRNDELRRCERHRIAISSSPEPTKTLDEGNTHFIELDSLHGDHIKMQLSQANGAVTTYTVELNGASGSISLADGEGNMIHINTSEKRVCMKNSTGSLLDISDENIMMVAKGNIVIKADDGITVQSGSDTTVVTGGNLNLN